MLPSQQGFYIGRSAGFQKMYTADSIGKRLFGHFTGFIAREHHLAKVGEHSGKTIQ